MNHFAVFILHSGENYISVPYFFALHQALVKSQNLTYLLTYSMEQGPS